MDLLDGLDRRIIAALQQDGRASWSHIARLCNASVPTVSRRARHLIDSGAIAIGIIPEPGYNGPTKQFFTWIKCEAGRQAEVAFAIARRPDVRFAALVTGDADIIAELVLPYSPSGQTRTILEISGLDGVSDARSDLIPQVHKITHDWSQQLLTPGEPYSKPQAPHRCDPSHFDEDDRALLVAMQADPRIAFRDLGREIGLDESTTRRKYLRLRDRGCISAVTLASAAALGFESEANLTIEVHPKKMARVVRDLQKHRSVRYLASIFNGSAVLCEVIAESSDELYRFTSETLAELDGVVRWRAAIELMTVKRGFIRTPWAAKAI